MLALVSSPVTTPHFSFDTKPAKALRGATLTDVVWNLHSILVNPASKLGEVKSAKQRMLRVLEETKNLPLPRMIAAPPTLPSDREKEKIVTVELPDGSSVCKPCKRLVTPALSQSQASFTKKARASSSRSFRTKRSDIRRGTVSSHKVPKISQ